ncbi:MAG: GGDEF domain-containing protein [Campylobacteraceae bacterium]|nr:GGDEF domain-containing protein [Campylobacteraceae bacterium]
MLQISVSKSLFDEILFGKIKYLKKDFSKYWQKELIDIKIENDKIVYSLKSVNKIRIINTLGKEKPQIVIECLSLNRNSDLNQFEFFLGSILEQKNTVVVDERDELIKQLLQEKEDMKNSMTKDFLTSLYNRQKLDLDLEISVNRIDASLLSLVFIDADKFKSINDIYGHSVGDEALKHLSYKLKLYCTSLNAEAYRYGGEEFILLCFKDKNELIPILNNLRIEIKRDKIKNTDYNINLSVSMGISFWRDVSSITELLKVADDNLFKAKDQGRDRIIYN